MDKPTIKSTDLEGLTWRSIGGPNLRSGDYLGFKNFTMLFYRMKFSFQYINC